MHRGGKIARQQVWLSHVKNELLFQLVISFCLVRFVQQRLKSFERIPGYLVSTLSSICWWTKLLGEWNKVLRASEEARMWLVASLDSPQS